jgi:murein DD-endopeptidase MepM/ murein hydrolase activator NlpD
VGLDAGELARYNGMQPDDRLREGEILALPERVSEPEGGPIRPADEVDITTLADSAISEADTGETRAAATGEARSGIEPIRHKVERGETAYSIARLYDVSLRSLAEWNGLGPDFAVQEGQYLLIPVVLPDEEDDPGAPLDATASAADTADTANAATTAPGQGSPTPTPPSAAKPLPEKDTAPASEPVETSAAPDLGAEQTQASAPDARMAYPVRGDIVRDYAKGKNDGIDIAATPGTAVKAAADGVVAAITEDTNGVPIIVLKHPDNLLTVYSNVAGVAVEKGDRVGRGDKLAEIRSEGTAAVHFEVREGFDSVDPTPYLDG